MPRLEEVFGISVQPVLSYVARPSVDDVFNQARGGDHHIVIYGSSKQGKTALRQKYIPARDCVVVRCGYNSTTQSIYQSILRQAGIRLDVFETITDHAKGTVGAKLGLKARIPFFGGAETEGRADAEEGTQTIFHQEFVGSDLGDAQAVAELLESAAFKKFVVLENFHYLPIETQRALSFDLKTFHELRIRFMILGIWREANLLLLHNGDLQDRVTEIPVEPWRSEDFDRVISVGSKHLEVEIEGEVCTEFKKNAYENVGMLQEFLKTFCTIHDVKETATPTRRLNARHGAMRRTFEQKLQDQRGQLLNILQGIAGKSRTDAPDPLILPYYLTKVVLTIPLDELVAGVHRRDLLEKIRALHHREDKDTVRPGDISYLLSRLPALQRDIQPPLLHYDTNQQRLRVVDTRQFFVLANVHRSEMFEEIPYPLDHDGR
jgi:hypothetical protein